jgi:hypothetical protein
MNKKQKIVLWIGIAVIVVMGIFPPWVHRGGPGVEKSAGYSFILNGPESYAFGWFARPDISRLFIQWVIVAVITAGLIITVKDKRT